MNSLNMLTSKLPLNGVVDDVRSRARRWGSEGWRTLAAVLGVVVMQSLIGCGDGSGGRRNIVLISIDTLRPDHLGAYGYHRSTSPRIDALAEQGVRFERAIVASSWTLPSHLSMLSGLYPRRHGVQEVRQRIADDVALLPQILQRQGFATGGFVSIRFLGPKYGFDRGFDAYELFRLKGKLIRGEDTLNAALSWLKGGEGARDVSKPFFLFLHLFDPHSNYDPPPPFDTRFDPGYEGPMDGHINTLMPWSRGAKDGGRSDEPMTLADLKHLLALYDGEIAYMDLQIGRLLDALVELGVADDTIVVFTADHGEEFLDHGSVEGHGLSLYEEVIRVPLIMRFPDGQAAGRVVDEPVETLGLAPTLLEAVGLPVPEEMFQGTSLLDLALGRETEGSEGVEAGIAFSETMRFGVNLVSARSRDWKVILQRDSGRLEAYHLAVDPLETRDLALGGKLPEEARVLRAELEDWMESAAGARTPRELELDQEAVDELKSLGYIR